MISFTDPPRHPLPPMCKLVPKLVKNEEVVSMTRTVGCVTNARNVARTVATQCSFAAENARKVATQGSRPAPKLQSPKASLHKFRLDVVLLISH